MMCGIKLVVTIIEQRTHIASPLSSIVRKGHIWVHVSAAPFTPNDACGSEINYWNFLLT